MGQYYIETVNADGKKINVEVSKEVYEVLTIEENRIEKREEYRKYNLYTLVENSIMENHRGHADYTFGNTIEEIELLDTLDSVLARCTPKQQRRFSMYFYNQMTMDEIAAIEKTGKQRIHKSIQQVRTRFKKFVQK